MVLRLSGQRGVAMALGPPFRPVMLFMRSDVVLNPFFLLAPSFSRVMPANNHVVNERDKDFTVIAC
jgi:hypothetical protein